ncbi:MAG: tyrosine-protein kinase [Solirubrobacteraceae bacterium]|nr:tyrosine-protein kinase [Solirubrobacteraceae bacterium]
MDDQRIGTILWRGKWIILVALVVGIGLSVLATKLADKVYEATAIFQVSAPSAQQGNVSAQDNQGLAKNYATVLTSRSFLQRIRPRVLRGRLTAADLESRLNAQTIQDTGLVELKAEGKTPAEAERLATQVSQAFLTTLQRDALQESTAQQAEIQRIIADYANRIDQLSSGPDANTPAVQEQIQSLKAARNALTRQSATLIANGVARGASATLTARPSASSSPVRPRPLLNAIAGALLGLLVGVGLVWLRERLSPALHSSEDAGEMLQVPVFASIPLKRKPMPGDPVLSEAYEVLRANLVFRARDDGLKVITFASYNPAVGKTSAVEGFAYAAVRGGANVLIVDGDLRVGALSNRLGHTDGPGLNGVVSGEASPDEALVSLAPGLSLLPARTPASNPPSLLYSEDMRNLVAHLRSRFDMIVIDSPPIEHLADALILASLSDGVVLVARTGVTKPEQLRSAALSLEQTDTPVIGLVVYEPRQIDRTYYPAMAQRPALDNDPAVPR